MSTASVLVEREEENIVLRPRLYAKHAGYLLIVPLLPIDKKTTLPPLPVEIWTKILKKVFLAEVEANFRTAGYVGKKKKSYSSKNNLVWKLALVCKLFKVQYLFPLAQDAYRLHCLGCYLSFAL